MDELELNILQGKQTPKTEENEIATKTDPAPCHILKCPNLSICQARRKKLPCQSKKSLKHRIGQGKRLAPRKRQVKIFKFLRFCLLFLNKI